MLGKDQIILGTAHFIEGYGTFGDSVDRAQAKTLLRVTQDAGFSSYDTAPGYGPAEEILGETLADNAEIITKTVHLDPNWSEGIRDGRILASLAASQASLRKEVLDGVLLHTPREFSPAVAGVLDRVKEQGLVKKVGVSVYESGEIDDILSQWRPDIVQLPLSILDQRLVTSGHIDRLLEAGVEVHARSVFLQGALLVEPRDLPSHLEPLMPSIAVLRERAHEDQDRIAGLCLGFVAERIPNGKIVVGARSSAQIDSLSRAMLLASTVEDAEVFSVNNPALVNPANWRGPRS